MRFKDEKDGKPGKMRKEWNRNDDSVTPAFKKFRIVWDTIDHICYLVFGYQLMLTSLGRPINIDKPSYHEEPDPQAGDWRTWDMPPGCYGLIEGLLISMRDRDPQIQYEFEPMIVKDGRIVRGEHLHAENDDNSLAKTDES